MIKPGGTITPPLSVGGHGSGTPVAQVAGGSGSSGTSASVQSTTTTSSSSSTTSTTSGSSSTTSTTGVRVTASGNPVYAGGRPSLG